MDKKLEPARPLRPEPWPPQALPAPGAAPKSGLAVMLAKACFPGGDHAADPASSHLFHLFLLRGVGGPSSVRARYSVFFA